MTTRPEPLFLDAVVRVDRLHPPGRDVAVVADAVSLLRLAEILDIIAVENFSATVTVSPFRGGVRALGSLKATIVQPSVVSLEPVTQKIVEPIDRVFMPGTAKPRDVPPGEDVFVDLEDDAPDELEGPDLDLSDLLTETLSLAIDPYPRAPGETLQSAGMDLDDGVLSPFAALKAIGKPDDD